ncbi:hypothetical protein BPUN_0764 [Candidatus Paraburkholderia kirkii]|nr:hypothetical protein BPUN_0764 [Candidatus Paraburkholderia kirkii]
MQVLESARRAAARSVNAIMTASYWENRAVDRRVGAGRCASGSLRGRPLIARLAADLTNRFGRGFGKANLANMRAFYQQWPPERMFQTVSGTSAHDPLPAPAEARLDVLAARFALPWSAYVRLLSVKSDAARAFYESEALRGAGRCASSTGR